MEFPIINIAAWPTLKKDEASDRVLSMSQIEMFDF